MLGYAYKSGTTSAAKYLQLIVSRGLRHERRVTWDTTAGDVDALLDCAPHSSKSGRGSAALLDLDAELGYLALAWVSSGTVAAHDEGGNGRPRQPGASRPPRLLWA